MLNTKMIGDHDRMQRELELHTHADSCVAPNGRELPGWLITSINR